MDIKPFGIIYKITNKINGKLYIGQTVQTIKSRWNDHRYMARKNKQSKLYFAIKKYGEENFTIESIESVFNKKELNDREKFWISYYNTCNSGYNIHSGGEVSTEEMEKLRLNASERMKSKKYWLGKKHSEDSKMRMSSSAKGRKVSQESIDKQKETRRNSNYIPITGGDRHNSIKVIRLDVYGNFVAEYDCIKNAAKQSKSSLQSIYNCLNDITLVAKNSRWIRKVDYYDGIILPEPKKHKVKFNRPIEQLSLSGEVIQEFVNITDAENRTNIKRGNIYVCLGTIRTTGGFKWRYKTEIDDNFYDTSKRFKKSNKIVQLDTNGTFIKVWDSISNASNGMIIGESGISACARGEQKTAGGYRWMRESEYKNLHNTG